MLPRRQVLRVQVRLNSTQSCAFSILSNETTTAFFERTQFLLKITGAKLNVSEDYIHTLVMRKHANGEVKGESENGNVTLNQPRALTRKNNNKQLQET